MALDEDKHVDRLIVHPYLQVVGLQCYPHIHLEVRIHPRNPQSTYFPNLHLQSLYWNDENVPFL